MPTALVVLAPGAEEIEFITVCDILVRAGVQVTVASAGETPVVKGSRGIPLAAHTLLDLASGGSYDLVYLPGGLGSANTCRDDARIQTLAETQLRSGRLLALICAAPIALVPRQLGTGRKVTSFPGARTQVEPHVQAWLDQPVVEDGNLITSQSAGTTMILALALARRLSGTQVAAKVAQDIIAPAAVVSAAGL